MNNVYVVYLCRDVVWYYTCIIICLWINGKPHQLGLRYERQLMSDGGAYSPFRSILLVLTHDFIITCVYGPTGSDRHERCAPFSCRL